MITLSGVVSRYGVECDAVLKMDCEGCEHDIIINDYESVKLFSELIFEYHVDQYRSLSRLLRVLARNYKCKIILERKHLGIMHCTKKFSKGRIMPAVLITQHCLNGFTSQRTS